MNEQERKEAQKRLDDEERRRRMSEGGEDMRAQLATEDIQRASQAGESRGNADYLTAQEEQQRRMMRGEGDVNRGLGETQRAEQAMWSSSSGGEGMAPTKERKVGSDQVSYKAGTGSYYSETAEKPTGTAGPESSFGRVEGEPRAKVESREQMVGEDKTAYRAGTGSYYSETAEKPVGTAGPESSFGRVEGEPRGAPRGGAPSEGGRMMSREEMMRTGSDQTAYPAGSGSYYSETFERPTGTAGPESSFGRTENVPSGRAAAMGAMGEGAMGVSTEKMKQTGGTVVEKSKEMGGQAVAKTKEVTSKLSESAKGVTKGQSAEDVAHRAGEVIGKAISKTVSVVKEMGSGLRSGLNPEEKQHPPEGEIVQRESYVKESPTTEKRKVEIEKKENV